MNPIVPQCITTAKVQCQTANTIPTTIRSPKSYATSYAFSCQMLSFLAFIRRNRPIPTIPRTPLAAPFLTLLYMFLSAHLLTIAHSPDIYKRRRKR